MKKLLGVVGVLLGLVVVALLILRVVGFDAGPTYPGLWLTGEVATEPVTDWSFAQKVGGLTGIQTRQWFMPILAHSVMTTRFIHKGRLYLASGYPAGIKLPDGRHWNRNIASDPRVRLKIGDKLYDRTLVYLTDPVEREEVLRAWGQMMYAPGFYLHLWRVEPNDEVAAN
jgi:hypothetical protein